MTFGSILAALMLLATACVQAEQLAEPGNLGPSVKVSGDFDVVLSQPKADSVDVYAVAFTAVETTSVLFCKRDGDQSCDGKKTFSMVFQKRDKAGFYFISASPLNFDDGTEILFLSYMSANGVMPSQKGTAIFRPGFVEAEGVLDSDGTEHQSDPTKPHEVSTSPQNGGISATSLIDIFAGFFGGGNATASTTPTTTPAPSSTSPATGITGTTQTDASLVPNPDKVPISASEFEVVKLTNAERVRQGKTALIVQQRIMVSSRESSRLMQQKNDMVHGLTSGWIGENIAKGYSSPALVVQGWIKSPGHYANMMGDFKYIGVGGTVDGGGSPYWTQQFNR